MKTLKKNTLFSWIFPIRSFLLLSLAATLFVSCRDNDDDDLPEPDAAAISVVNASPGQTAFNFAFDNQIVNGPALTFGIQSGYLLAYAGQRKFDATLGGTNQSVLTETITLEKDKYYSLFISGSSSLSAFLTADDVSAPASGKAKIRFIQLSPDAGTLALNIKGGATLFNGQDFKTASAFAAIDPATYTLEIKNTGGTAIAEKEVTIAAGKIYTVWAGGMLAGTGNTAMTIFVNANN